MKYHSTRGKDSGLSFQRAFLSGYASDGGMLLPESFPTVSLDTVKSWRDLSYPDLAYEVVSLYIGADEIPRDDLKDILNKSYATFSNPEIVPVTQLSKGLNIVELYHGRSLAFKDLAMSCMGNFYNYFLTKSQRHMNLLVATSGDTGSSAIEAVRGFPLVDIFVLLPRGRCTVIQERQMTTVLDSNVHVFRADGSSDDIDVALKRLYCDNEFATKYNITSPSSLNFVRILIQLVHFFHTYLKICPSCSKEAELILPTGGGGNVTAGVIARKMGLPVKFVCAVNHNNILSRIMSTGQCDLGPVETTLAPAMDIQFAYNMERVWFLCSNEDDKLIRNILKQVDEGRVCVPMKIIEKMKKMIQIYTISGDEDIKSTIKRCWTENNYNICPHTAVGVSYFYSWLDTNGEDSVPRAVLATASPLKFPEAIEAAGVPAPTSDQIKHVLSAPTRFVDMEAKEDWAKIVRTKIEEVTSNIATR